MATEDTAPEANKTEEAPQEKKDEGEEDEGRSRRRRDDDGRNEGKKSLLVRNLSFDTNKHDLREAFEKHGSVRDVYIPLDYKTRDPRGFAFVEFTTAEGAANALEAMDGATFDGRAVRVVYAQQQRKRPEEMAEIDRRTKRSRRDDDYYGTSSRRRRDDSRSRSRDRVRSERRSRRDDDYYSSDRRRRKDDDYDRL